MNLHVLNVFIYLIFFNKILIHYLILYWVCGRNTTRTRGYTRMNFSQTAILKYFQLLFVKKVIITSYPHCIKPLDNVKTSGYCLMTGLDWL